jgi:hypothetical protein
MVIFLKSMVVVAILIFIIGLIKPKWVLFWMKEPDRLTATTIGLFVFMASMTGLAKLTVKPKPPQSQEREAEAPRQHRSVDDMNELQLDRR